MKDNFQQSDDSQISKVGSIMNSRTILEDEVYVLRKFLETQPGIYGYENTIEVDVDRMLDVGQFFLEVGFFNLSFYLFKWYGNKLLVLVPSLFDYLAMFMLYYELLDHFQYC